MILSVLRFVHETLTDNCRCFEANANLAACPKCLVESATLKRSPKGSVGVCEHTFKAVDFEIGNLHLLSHFRAPF